MIKIRNFFSQFGKLLNRSFLILLCIFTVFHLLVLILYISYYTGQKNYELRNVANTVLEQLVIHASKTMPKSELQTSLNILTKARLRISGYKLAFALQEASQPLPLDALRAFDLSKNFTFIKTPKAGSNAQRQLITYNHPCSSFFSTFYNHHNYYYPLQDGQRLYFSTSCSNVLFTSATVFIILEVITIVLILFYIWSIARFTRPLYNFKRSAERLGIDLKTEPLVEGGPALIRETADAMNRMQERIHNLIKARTRLLASISHDLRTPITRLKLRTQFLPDLRQSEKFLYDLTEMEIMITEILAFSRDDMDQRKKKKFDMNALLLSVCHDFTDKGSTIIVKSYKNRIPFVGYSLALKRTFNNLIENAIKYSDSIWVKLDIIKNKIVITIEDNGPGLPDDELDKVVNPFYRSANTPNQNNSGMGLGLTIANEIINEHNGTLVLKNRNRGGLKVVITLPQFSNVFVVDQHTTSTDEVNI